MDHDTVVLRAVLYHGQIDRREVAFLLGSSDRPAWRVTSAHLDAGAFPRPRWLSVFPHAPHCPSQKGLSESFRFGQSGFLRGQRPVVTPWGAPYSGPAALVLPSAYVE